jgi:hypothetical protein
MNYSNGMNLQLNSLVESEGGKKQIKIRNFQALIDDNYNHNSRTTNSGGSGSLFCSSSGASQSGTSGVPF